MADRTCDEADDGAGKTCTKCGLTQSKTEFTTGSSKTRDGLHSWCRACLRALAKANYDPERARAKHASKKADPVYRAMKKAAYDRWRAEHPERARAASVRWEQANPERHALAVRQGSVRRRLREKEQADGTVSYQAVLDTYGMHCHLCDGAIASLADLHFDHVVPLSRGGRHAQDNLRPSHALCNKRKGNRTA